MLEKLCTLYKITCFPQTSKTNLMEELQGYTNITKLNLSKEHLKFLNPGRSDFFIGQCSGNHPLLSCLNLLQSLLHSVLSKFKNSAKFSYQWQTECFISICFCNIASDKITFLIHFIISIKEIDFNEDIEVQMLP